jgi:hypothetical protein
MKDAFTVDIDIINISKGPESAWPRATTPWRWRAQRFSAESGPEWVLTA